METRIVCFNDETITAIWDYAKVRRLDFSNAVNDLVVIGYRTACEELKKHSLEKESKRWQHEETGRDRKIG